MSFDWSTFALEVLNFGVLVWLLQRFLYRPVLAVIDKRRADGVQATVAAQALRAEALALKADCEVRLAHMADDRAQALSALNAEVAAERARRLAAVEVEADTERARQRALDARDRLERDAGSERRAVAAAARFATRLLGRVAGPALEERLVDLALAELPALPDAQREAMQAALEAPAAQLQVVSAYALAPPRRAALTAALGAMAGRALAPEFQVDPALMAGVSIRAGAWVLMANLRDELEFFSVNLDHGE